MGSCIICGTPADGAICESHEQDVLFEFAGDNPNQLTSGRYYSGTVDGFAEFGVFVNIGDRVTGLLHKSELDQRLDSLDWDEGDEVFVQVTGVRDNGNVDLGWSIRQSERELRGKLLDDPERGAVLPEDTDATDGDDDSDDQQATTDGDDDSDDQQATTDGAGTVDPAEREADESEESEASAESDDADAQSETESDADDSSETAEESADTTDESSADSTDDADAEESQSERARVTIDSLSDRVDEDVRI